MFMLCCMTTSSVIDGYNTLWPRHSHVCVDTQVTTCRKYKNRDGQRSTVQRRYSAPATCVLPRNTCISAALPSFGVCPTRSCIVSKQLQIGYDHSCYGMRIGNRTQVLEWYHFNDQASAISNPEFKITPLFDAEYTTSGTK